MPSAGRHLASFLSVVAAATVAGTAWAFPGSAEAFEQGRPQVSTSRTGSLVSVAGMKPGQRVSRVVTVRNTGDAAGRFGLSARTTGSAQLIRRLRISVAVSDRRATAYAGGLGALREVHLATLAPGKSVRVELEVRFISTADDDWLQGLTGGACFIWSAKA